HDRGWRDAYPSASVDPASAARVRHRAARQWQREGKLGAGQLRIPSPLPVGPCGPTEAINRNIGGGGGVTFREPQAFRTVRPRHPNANTVSLPRARKWLLP